MIKTIKLSERERYNIRKSLNTELWKEGSVEKPQQKRLRELYKLLFKIQGLK